MPVPFQKLQQISAQFERSVKMNQIEKCAVIKFLFVKNMSCNDVHCDMFIILINDAVSQIVIKMSFAEFKCGKAGTDMIATQDNLVWFHEY